MVRSYIPYDMRSRLSTLEVFDELPSSNDHLLATAGDYAGGFQVCFAESQTQGKGRRGNRQWVSPRCGSIYMSVMHRCPDMFPTWLGLVSAMEVAAGFKALGSTYMGVKWPNDIYCSQGKVGGVLVEKKNNICVVGVGVNLYLPKQLRLSLPKQVATLEDVLPTIISRNMIAAVMTEAIVRTFDTLAKTIEIDWLMKRFCEFDMLHNKRIQVQCDNQQPLDGVATGVTEMAELRVRHDDRIKIYQSAQVSVSW